MNHTYRLVWSPTQQRYVPTAETARSRGKSASGKALLPAAVVLSTALLSSPGFAQAPPALAPNALPTGGQVVAGQASIGQQGSQMTVTQGSDKAILNWNSFNIGQDARVQFQQPGSSAVALNRVVAGDASQIQGQLSANGQVWLVNPNGVVFGAGSRVDVGGLVASTLDITDKDFLDGKAIFKRDGATGGIVNEGQITAVGDGEQGGLIALLAPTVRNDGVLTAKLGNVALAAGDRITLNAGANGLLQVEVEPATLRTLVENRQMIVADGGQVVMTGKAADALSGSVVANTGTVQARTISNQQGRIMLLGDAEHGSVQVSGLLDASSSSDPLASAQVGQQLNAGATSVPGGSSAPGGHGGSIEVTGQQVTLAAATLDASGATGGGDIKAGGGWQGGGTLARAKTTTVDASSRLKADATQKGDGGKVVVWSDDKTAYAGHISAKGGSKGGNGGKAEVSGKAVLEFAGTADMSAAKGRSGDLLLDPYNMTITGGSGGTPDGNNNFVAAANDSTLGVNTLTNLLATANVTVSTGGTGSPGAQAGNITVNAPVAWSANNVLTLEAAGDIAINQNITATGVNAGLVLSHGTGKDYQLGEGASVTLSGTSATLKIGATGALNTYTLLRDVNALQAIPASSTGNFALAGDIDASPLSSGAGFAPIANFGGTFTGLGHVINGLTINRPLERDVGLFGMTTSGSTIRNVGIVGGSVLGRESIGTLAGVNKGAIAHAYATGTAQGLDRAVGGLVGDNTGSISGAYATGAVVGARVTGGLVGDNRGSIKNTYATGSVTWTDTGSGQDLGGLVGYHEGSINQAYATGAVRGRDRVGGLAGIVNAGGTIAESYATGAVTGTAMGNLGGLVGLKTSGTVTTSFYTTTDAGGSLINNGGVASGAWAGNANGTGKTYAELMNPVTFSGWNTAIWNVARGNTAPGYEVGLPALTGVTPAATIVRSTLFQGGMGTTGNPYGITDWQQLANINQVLAGGYTFNLNNNLDGSSGGYNLLAAAVANGGLGWKPLGSSSTPFIGTFDGKNRSVSNLVINRPLSDEIGLFGYLGNGSLVGDIGVLDASVRGRTSVGALTGASAGGSTITKAYASGDVKGVSGVGGLIGGNQSSISDAYASATVNASQFRAGGLTGSNLGTITRSYATGAVSGGRENGGLVGLNQGTIEHAYATGAVSGSNFVGGLVGQNDGHIDHAYATGTVSGTGDLGGLTGGSGIVAGTTTNAFYATTNAGGSINNNGNTNGGWAGNANGSAKTLAELMGPGTFVGWDTSIWDFGRGDLVAGYEGGLPVLTGVTRPADTVRATLFQGGMGTAGNPYGIADWQHLANIYQVLKGGYSFNLGNNLDSSTSGYGALASATANGNLGWKPLGMLQTPFTGTFEGQDHTISNLVINRPTEPDVGLFGIIHPDSTVRNVGVVGASVMGWDGVGGLAGSNFGTISNAYATGTVQSRGNAVGGLVGTNFGSITQAYASALVTGGTYVGGLVGNNQSIIDQSYATGAVTRNGISAAGGLVGDNVGTVTRSFYATTQADGSPINNAGTIDNTWTGNAIGTGKTHAEMTASATFSNWGADLATTGGSTAAWRIYDGNTTPLLRSFLQAATVTADLSGASKVYDGAIASGTPGYTHDAASPLLGTLSYASNSANAGTYANTNGSLQLAGLYSGQQGYDISYAPASLVITRAPLVPGVPGDTPDTITGILTGTVRKTYDGTTFATLTPGNFLLSGWVNNDGAVVTQTRGRYDSANAGSGKTVTVDLARSDYQATGTTNLGNYILPTQISGAVGTIDRAALIITANDANKVYDGQAWRGGNGVRYSGFVNGETASVLAGALTYGGTSQGAVNAGSYRIAPSGLSAGNYAIAFADGTLLVSQVALQAITGTLAGTVRKTYDGTTVATLGSGNFLLSGWVNEDGATVTQTAGRYDSADAGNGKTVTVDLARGDYRATGTTNLGNYILPTQVTSAVGTIDRATLQSSIVGTVQKTYDGTTTAMLGSGNFLLSGWAGSDGAIVTQTRGRYDNANAGKGKTVIVDLARSDYQATDTTRLSNYVLPTQASAALGTIDKAALTVAANDAGKVADGQAWQGGNGVRYRGFVNGENAAVLAGSLTYGGSAQGAVDAGNYVLTARGLSSGNYAIGYQDGTLSVASQPGNGNPGGNPGSNPGTNDPGTGNTGNGQPPGMMASAPSGSSVWRAVNRDTPSFVLSPEEREPHRDNSVMHLSVAPDFIRLEED